LGLLLLLLPVSEPAEDPTELAGDGGGSSFGLVSTVFGLFSADLET